MNNLDYLNEISKSNRKVKVEKAGIPTSLVIKLSVVGAILIAIIIGLGVIIGNNESKSIDLTRQLYSRTKSLRYIVHDYNNYVKSSKLLSISISLETALSNGETYLELYFDETGATPEITKADVLADETAMMTNLETTFLRARLNGLLDRYYPSELQLQVTLMMALISKDIERSQKEPALVQRLESYRDNLKTIEDSFKEYISL